MEFIIDDEKIIYFGILIVLIFVSKNLLFVLFTSLREQILREY